MINKLKMAYGKACVCARDEGREDEVSWDYRYITHVIEITVSSWIVSVEYL